MYIYIHLLCLYTLILPKSSILINWVLPWQHMNLYSDNTPTDMFPNYLNSPVGHHFFGVENRVYSTNIQIAFVPFLTIQWSHACARFIVVWCISARKTDWIAHTHTLAHIIPGTGLKNTACRKSRSHSPWWLANYGKWFRNGTSWVGDCNQRT